MYLILNKTKGKIYSRTIISLYNKEIAIITIYSEITIIIKIKSVLILNKIMEEIIICQKEMVWWKTWVIITIIKIITIFLSIIIPAAITIIITLVAITISKMEIFFKIIRHK